MSKQTALTIRQAAEQWVNDFNFVPVSVIEKMAESDANIKAYDSDSFRLIASSRIECLTCGASFGGELSLEELSCLYDAGKGVPCESCGENLGDLWGIGRPEYAFPCAWSTLFSPKNPLDIEWILCHKDEIAQIGLFVFESEQWDVLLGIDGAGFDFYEAFWIPLYKLRGLNWHDSD